MIKWKTSPSSTTKQDTLPTPSPRSSSSWRSQKESIREWNPLVEEFERRLEEEEPQIRFGEDHNNTSAESYKSGGGSSTYAADHYRYSDPTPLHYSTPFHPSNKNRKYSSSYNNKLNNNEENGTATDDEYLSSEVDERNPRYRQPQLLYRHNQRNHYDNNNNSNNSNNIARSSNHPNSNPPQHDSDHYNHPQEAHPQHYQSYNNNNNNFSGSNSSDDFESPYQTSSINEQDEIMEEGHHYQVTGVLGRRKTRVSSNFGGVCNCT